MISYNEYRDAIWDGRAEGFENISELLENVDLHASKDYSVEFSELVKFGTRNFNHLRYEQLQDYGVNFFGALEKYDTFFNSVNIEGTSFIKLANELGETLRLKDFLEYGVSIENTNINELMENPRINLNGMTFDELKRNHVSFENSRIIDILDSGITFEYNHIMDLKKDGIRFDSFKLSDVNNVNISTENAKLNDLLKNGMLFDTDLQYATEVYKINLGGTNIEQVCDVFLPNGPIHYAQLEPFLNENLDNSIDLMNKSLEELEKMGISTSEPIYTKEQQLALDGAVLDRDNTIESADEISLFDAPSSSDISNVDLFALQLDAENTIENDKEEWDLEENNKEDDEWALPGDVIS